MSHLNKQTFHVVEKKIIQQILFIDALYKFIDPRLMTCHHFSFTFSSDKLFI